MGMLWNGRADQGARGGFPGPWRDPRGGRADQGARGGFPGPWRDPRGGRADQGARGGFQGLGGTQGAAGPTKGARGGSGRAYGPGEGRGASWSSLASFLLRLDVIHVSWIIPGESLTLSFQSLPDGGRHRIALGQIAAASLA
jgi:hypothetical protein